MTLLLDNPAWGSGLDVDAEAEAAMERWADSGPRIDLEAEVIAPPPIDPLHDPEPYEMRLECFERLGLDQELTEGLYE